ncbi:uncharacterized protein LALA0_S02e08152g [Lachancea lanzarotensis]|uniref:LALA0S02e08152g1_1 n=1 Tax=Lachancea lanzarotensis TaxID=1245769 RepID=A0A0C7N3H3_9SACH|nr:uncharacterized protein LALA0_S02e08152g [Lachancea lanzarotensis]CEP61164.1 LALA0S02e08152g1_1 [Lachancea lanzarotensis]
MAEETLYSEDEWLVTVRNGFLEVYFEQGLVNCGLAEGYNEFQCFKLADDSDRDQVLSIFGKKAGNVVRMWFEPGSDVLQEECVLGVNFVISSFRVLPTLGWILSTDSVSGVLHIFDTLNNRYKGQIRLDTEKGDGVYVIGAREFMVLARKFDQDSLLLKTFLNTYVVDKENQIFLTTSVPADHHHLQNCWVCCNNDSNSGTTIGPESPFALVSSDTKGSLVEFFISGAQIPFQKLTLPETVLLSRQIWFSAPFNVVLVLQTPENTIRISEFDIITSQETRTAMLWNGADSYYKESGEEETRNQKTDVLSQVHKPSSSFSLLQFLGKIPLAHRSVLVFIPNLSPNVILTWQNETLETWQCPSAVLKVSAASAAANTLRVECRARASSGATEIFHIEIP